METQRGKGQERAMACQDFSRSAVRTEKSSAEKNVKVSKCRPLIGPLRSWNNAKGADQRSQTISVQKMIKNLKEVNHDISPKALVSVRIRNLGQTFVRVAASTKYT